MVQDVAVGVRGFNEVCRRSRGEARGVGYTHPAVDAVAGRIVGGEGHGGQEVSGMVGWRGGRGCGERLVSVRSFFTNGQMWRVTRFFDFLFSINFLLHQHNVYVTG